MQPQNTLSCVATASQPSRATCVGCGGRLRAPRSPQLPRPAKIGLGAGIWGANTGKIAPNTQKGSGGPLGGKTHCTQSCIAQRAVALATNIMPDLIVFTWLRLVHFESGPWAVIGLVPSSKVKSKEPHMHCLLSTTRNRQHSFC